MREPPEASFTKYLEAANPIISCGPLKMKNYYLNTGLRYY